MLSAAEFLAGDGRHALCRFPHTSKGINVLTCIVRHFTRAPVVLHLLDKCTNLSAALHKLFRWYRATKLELRLKHLDAALLGEHRIGCPVLTDLLLHSILCQARGIPSCCL